MVKTVETINNFMLFSFEQGRAVWAALDLIDHPINIASHTTIQLQPCRLQYNCRSSKLHKESNSQHC